MGGMFGESKYDILKDIPQHLVPKTVLVKLPATAASVEQQCAQHGMRYPLICKPDIGERGFQVKRINHADELSDYLKTIHVDFIVQELVDLPVECGVMYVRYPDQPTGHITSLTLKEMLTVTGDGQHTLQELILDKDRAVLQWKKLQPVYAHRLQEIIPAGETVLLNAIGNHSLGTKFINGERYINAQLNETFDRISKQIPEFYFGRFDLRTASIDDLYAGRVKILELNGCGAEPAHIYDPDFSFFRALKVMFRHWYDLYRISSQNKKRGVNYLTLKEGLKAYRRFKEVVR